MFVASDSVQRRTQEPDDAFNKRVAEKMGRLRDSVYERQLIPLRELIDDDPRTPGVKIIAVIADECG